MDMTDMLEMEQDIENKCARFVLPALPKITGSEKESLERCKDFLHHERRAGG
jgi:hypothetical protein